ncbi:MAG: (d)CMP kinase [Hyphomicrobiaceae bacterium TMED74]|nr:cytidylate kinase [Filomicrobium sp.]RPG46964.1 MAG: (d)CMP kinase [Hyphomicrobiaceae bacterium TMED74]
MIIAVDGPAASGKGTVSRKIADLYGFSYLDTGLLYRAVARDVAAAGASLEAESDALKAAQSLDFSSLDDDSLRITGVGEAASIVARYPSVRATLLDLQLQFSRKPPGAVLDGRDIGTVVCPNADAKLYVTADPEIRAERRFLELSNLGESVTREGVLEMILQRDARDTERADSPMRPAADAMLLDTTKLDIMQSFDAAVELIKRKIGLPGT